ncbi:uncharacterized protein [Haliotis cracherodii]|uniref:uncharacterized protein n=1 Tax=Haliotis cracherodii TaxID=6455 RepID=UPI0039E94E88
MQHELFQVHITGKDGAAKRCHLKGDYLLVVKDSSLCLCSVRSNQVIFEWPFTKIRCYGYTDKAFNYAVGRFTCSGEGMFSIKTKDGCAIHKAVHEKVQLMKRDKDLKRRRRATHRSESVPQTSVRVRRRRKSSKKRNTGSHECEFGYSEPYSFCIRTRISAYHEYLSMCETPSSAAAGNDEYMELYDELTGRCSEYTRLNREYIEPQSSGVYETLKPATRECLTRTAKGQLL